MEPDIPADLTGLKEELAAAVRGGTVEVVLARRPFVALGRLRSLGLLTDEDLVGLCRLSTLTGKEAFEVLWQRYRVELFRWFVRVGRLNPAAADELLADHAYHFYRICRTLYDPARGPFRAYVFGAARRWLRHRHRQARRQPACSLDAVAEPPAPDPIPDDPPPDPGRYDDWRQHLRELLPELSQLQRYVVRQYLANRRPRTIATDERLADLDPRLKDRDGKGRYSAVNQSRHAAIAELRRHLGLPPRRRRRRSRRPRPG